MIRGTVADPKSIMCYRIPGEITKNGKPIVGGLDIDVSDYKFAGQIYPKSAGAPKKPVAEKKSAGAGTPLRRLTAPLPDGIGSATPPRRSPPGCRNASPP